LCRNLAFYFLAWNIADFKVDILWRNDNGSVETWEMNGALVLAANLTNPYPVVNTSRKISAPIL
jgi:hypothetical protein